MGRTVRDTNLESRAARGRLTVRGKPYYRSIETGCHIGYRKGKRGGKWVVRIGTGFDEYRVKTIGIADDVSDADGVRVLDWKQAQNKARKCCNEEARKAAGKEPAGPYSVKDTLKDYMADYEGRGGKHAKDMGSRINAFIIPKLGEKEVRVLSTGDIRKWHRDLAKEPPRLRSGKGQPVKHRDISNDPEATRKRRYSANKVLTILKSALNFAWHEGKVASDDAWRRVKPFKGVDAPRIRYLKKSECRRLINACESELRRLVQAALFTGCRYGELAAAKAGDFNPDSGTLTVSESKSGKPRHVVLTDEGRKFFEREAAGKASAQLLFPRGDSKQWGKSHQTRPLADACDRAKIAPRAGFHVLRHTYASHLVMNGVPIGVVSQNLGHADTRMTERHYAHLAPSYVADAIRAGAPELGIAEDDNVTPLPVGKGGG